MNEVHYWFDGGGGGEGGPCGWGWVRDDGTTGCGALPPGCTSNEAEYTALTMAVHDAMVVARRGESAFVFKGDSKLVVEQVTGNWQVHANKLRPYVNNVKMLLDGLPQWGLLWIPRKQNSRADEMAWLGKSLWEGDSSKAVPVYAASVLPRGWEPG